MKKYQKIRFSGDVTSHKNGSARLSIKTVVTMDRTMFMYTSIQFNEYIFSTNLFTMAIYYSVWIYNWIHNMKSGSSAIGIWSRSRFEPVADTLNNCHVWGCPKYVLEPKLQKPGVKIPKWDPRSRRGFNMGFSKMH